MGGYLGIFCDGLQLVASGRNHLQTIQTSTGIFADYRFNVALAAYAEVLQAIWVDVLTPSDYPAPGQTVANSAAYDCENNQADCQANLSGYSWMYQVCSEFGKSALALATA